MSVRGQWTGPALAPLPLAVLAVIGLTAAYMPGDPEPGANLLVNPTMEIDQANEGAAVASSAGSLNAYVVDGVKAALTSTASPTKAAVSCQRAADAPSGYAYSAKCTVTTGASSVGAGDNLIFFLPIEADELQDALLGTAGAQTLCAQWQVKSSIAGYTYGWAIQNYANTRSYPNAATVASANTWTPFAACFTGDTGGTWVTSGNAGGGYLIVAAAAGATFQGTGATWAGANTYGTSALTNTVLTTTGATFQITNVKLEVGPAATPFRRRPIADELLRCERYYLKTYEPGTAVASATHNGMVGGSTSPNGSLLTAVSVTFPAAMRAAPTVAYYDGAGNSGKSSFYITGSGWSDNQTAPTTLAATAKSLLFASTSNGITIVHFTADSRL